MLFLLPHHITLERFMEMAMCIMTHRYVIYIHECMQLHMYKMTIYKIQALI